MSCAASRHSASVSQISIVLTGDTVGDRLGDRVGNRLGDVVGPGGLMASGLQYTAGSRGESGDKRGSETACVFGEKREKGSQHKGELTPDLDAAERVYGLGVRVPAVPPVRHVVLVEAAVGVSVRAARTRSRMFLFQKSNEKKLESASCISSLLQELTSRPAGTS